MLQPLETLEHLPRRLRWVLNLQDFETAARRHLPHPLHAFVSGGSEDNVSRDGNRAAYAEYGLVPRVLVNVAERSTASTLLGESYAHPFGIAPLGICAISAYRGDIVLAKAAAQARIPMVLSGSSLIRLEDVAQAAPGSWFQAYLPGDAACIEPLIERVAQAGYRTLVLTVDTPVLANRENNIRAGFSAPLRPSLRLAWDGVSHPRWLFGTFLRTLWRHGIPYFENNYATRDAPVVSRHVLRSHSGRGHLDWKHFDAVRRMWPGRLLVKGVLSVHDARHARDAGADGIVVSNHGGRQLDGSVSPLRVLPAIVAACPEIPVMIDGGIRRGIDVVKALALGAKFVFVGRPFNFAAAVGGLPAVRHAIAILASEIDRDLGLLGVTRLSDLNAEHLMRLPPSVGHGGR